MRNEPGWINRSARPPGKYMLPVIPVSTSAAARLKVLCPETYPWKEGVTNVDCWYGIHVVPRIQSTPGGPPEFWCHARTAIFPSLPRRDAIGPPSAVLAFVMISVRPASSGSPSLLYAG